MDLKIAGVRSDINEMLSKIRDVSNRTDIFSGVKKIASQESVPGFENMLSIAKNAISDVSALQANNEQIRTAYVTGTGDVSMSQVLLASQKSKLAFEGLLAVRNKFIDAYKEIMNMPV